MTDDMITLGKRATACKGWRWLPGMRAMPTEGMVAAPLRLTDDYDWPHDLGLRLPDLSDPATLGCLLALVREAWRCAMITSPDYEYDEEEARQGETVIGWRAVETVRWVTVGEGVTEAEALVAALEAAP